MSLHPNNKTVALSGSDSQDVRTKQVNRLTSGLLDYIFTVDIFNEGIDIPEINQVVMLRNTQSSIIFVQQMGRGLRKHDEWRKYTWLGYPFYYLYKSQINHLVLYASPF